MNEDDYDEARKSAWASILQGSLPAWIACVLSISCLIWQAAITTQKVNENNRRIMVLESGQQEQAKDNRDIGNRLASIEAKLDLMIDGYKR